MFCKKCGMLIETDTKFCSVCGWSTTGLASEDAHPIEARAVKKNIGKILKKYQARSVVFCITLVVSIGLVFVFNAKFAESKYFQEKAFSLSNLKCLEESKDIIINGAEEFKTDVQQLIRIYQTTDVAVIDKEIVAGNTLTQLKTTKDEVQTAYDTLIDTFNQSGLSTTETFGMTENDFERQSTEIIDSFDEWRTDLMKFSNTMKRYNSTGEKSLATIVMQTQRDLNSTETTTFNYRLDSFTLLETQIQLQMDAFQMYVEKEQKKIELYFAAMVISAGCTVLSLSGLIICIVKLNIKKCNKREEGKDVL